MKKQLLTLLGLGLLFATSSAYAQTMLQANVPFNFIVAGKTLPAGEYTVHSLGTIQRVLFIQGSDMSQMVVVNSCASAKPSGTAKLVFHRYGERYFLSQIWTAGNSSGAELPPSSRESEVAMGAPRQDIVLVASR